MKILFVASESVPFVKTGGLADVVGALAPVLAAQGHDVRVIIPDFSAIPQEYTEKMVHVCDFEVQLGWRRQYCGIEKIEMDGVTWYFMDNKFYFGRPYIYGMGGDEYERFGFFCRHSLLFFQFSLDKRIAQFGDLCQKILRATTRILHLDRETAKPCLVQFGKGIQISQGFLICFAHQLLPPMFLILFPLPMQALRR